ncbi:hypothetical protein O159_18330 [Leifsonia xyli subsp. cynodontis DSM 46306]|jgi:cytochrome bd-type quinol oxidase subunit 2|uniref:Cardiolipin synthase N-terminal domain-containing protein n=1 Tax=Leifsonia xyli subsp. cynodontis DSM 46306 TaxID=1389489 RepID=U3PAV5_LEIXC|nr:hypothetical protein [Leifsonia xyli]AGW41857.1 hypothetical protein O159_18330 [Leifsonia xyli subsp. cynodontis DSM 46306]
MLTNTASPLHLIVLLVVLAQLVGAIWAIVVTWMNKTVRAADKASWTVLLVLAPLVGIAVWLAIFFPRRHRLNSNPEGSVK